MPKEEAVEPGAFLDSSAADDALADGDGGDTEPSGVEMEAGLDEEGSEPDEGSPLVGPAIEKADVIPDDVLAQPGQDAFKHQAIAQRVVDLLTRTAPPFNVALFGAWGSGKSSLARLLEAELARRRDRTQPYAKLILYNAWKLGGEQLHRNFITHAANQLGFDEQKRRNRQFHRGLYEGRRTLDFTAVGVLKNLSIALLFGVLAAALLSGAVLGVVEFVQGQDAELGKKFERAMPGALFGVGLASLVTGLLAFAARAGTVEVDESAPSESEEFSLRFRELITVAKRGQHPHLPELARGLIDRDDDRVERVIFFIDELDRCSEKDIVATLTATKAFLDEEDCIFVIAADRDVLERALSKAPQPTPANDVTPYYSSASAFLDKIFQFQLDLPPLRGRRLSRFGRQLIERQMTADPPSRFWGDLAVVDDGELLELVLYALIPSHVRSPRRVKVLLNHFSVFARVAETRGIEWPGRAPEIAKLIALRTEFPNFAQALFHEPRLTEWFTMPDSELTTPQKERVDALHPDAYIAAPADESGDEALSERRKIDAELARKHREQLRRYLERTAEVDDPGQDLMFLEPAGDVFGLDPELGERIERDAPDVPEEVLEELQTEPQETRCKAALLLADMVQELVGPERGRVMTALMGLVASIDQLGPVAAQVHQALLTFRKAEDFDERHLVGALRVALHVEPDPLVYRKLVSNLFSDERLLAAPERVSDVTRMAARLSAGELTRVKEAQANFIPDDMEVVLAPLEALDDATASSLLNAEVVWQAIAGYIAQHTEVEARASLERLIADALTRAQPDVAVLIWDRLLTMDESIGYEIARDHADDLFPRLPRDEVDLRALRAWGKAPLEDSDFWKQRLQDNPADAND